MTWVAPLIGAVGVLLLFDGLTTPRKDSSRRWAAGAARRADEAGVRWLNPTRQVAMATAGGILTLIIVTGITGSLVVATPFVVLAARLPSWILTSKQRRRQSELREAWPDALASLVSSVRAGISLPEACGSLAGRGPSELSEGFEVFVAVYRSSGSFPSALARLRDRLADPIADRVSVALILANDVGGTDLVRVLRTLGEFVREDLRTRKEVEARWSWTVTAARVAAAAPWVVLLLMSTRPEAASAYASGGGALILAIGAGATIIGYRLMLRAARLPEERRLAQ